MTLNSDLWELFRKCSQATHNCIGCKYNNMRFDGMCCSLVDRIDKKLMEADKNE